jgi:hypothetical protein
MRISFLDNTLHGSSQTSSRTSHNATPLDVGFFRDEVLNLGMNKNGVFNCVLTSELNSSQSGYNHYYNFSDLREADGAR